MAGIGIAMKYEKAMKTAQVCVQRIKGTLCQKINAFYRKKHLRVRHVERMFASSVNEGEYKNFQFPIHCRLNVANFLEIRFTRVYVDSRIRKEKSQKGAKTPK